MGRVRLVHERQHRACLAVQVRAEVASGEERICHSTSTLVGNSSGARCEHQLRFREGEPVLAHWRGSDLDGDAVFETVCNSGQPGRIRGLSTLRAIEREQSGSIFAVFLHVEHHRRARRGSGQQWLESPLLLRKAISPERRPDQHEICTSRFHKNHKCVYSVISVDASILAIPATTLNHV